MPSRSDPILLAALTYAKRGWPVFPVRERDKRPIPSNGFKAATTEREMILAWWTMYPHANVGIATGHAFDVLDIDGPDGAAALGAYLRSQGIEEYRHDGPVSLTGKGWHLLFGVTGEGNRAGLLGAPLDFRGLGGYIVAPPSIHPLGHRYRWHQKGRRTDAAPVPEAPPWLTRLVGKTPATRPAPNAGVTWTEAPDGTPTVVVASTGKIAETRPDILVVADSLGMDYELRGHYAMCRCPFHADDTPSLALYPAPQDKFYCHGCGAHGDSHDLASHRDINGRVFA